MCKLVWKFDILQVKFFKKYVQTLESQSPTFFEQLKKIPYQWCRKVKKFGGASSKWWAESALIGWNRVNWSAKYWGASAPPPSPLFRHHCYIESDFGVLKFAPHSGTWCLIRGYNESFLKIFWQIAFILLPLSLIRNFVV